MKNILTLLVCLLTIVSISAQNNIFKGYVYDDEHEDRLSSVSIVLSQNGEQVGIAQQTNYEGEFSINVPKSGDYMVEFTRNAYEKMATKITVGAENNSPMAIPMTHLPDYEFTGVIKEFVADDILLGEGVEQAKIEVYNNTSGKQIFTSENHPKQDFVVHFKKKNRYTVLVRKDGYFPKRFDVVVDQDGCTVCFYGLAKERLSGILDNHTPDELTGSITGDIPLRKINLNEVIAIENIYYNYDKATLKSTAIPPLNNLVQVMKSTPIIIELSSHTDSRGKDAYNMDLSLARAQSVVDFLIKNGIAKERLTANGYGETRLVNECSNDVPCTEEQHQANRRTDFKVVGLMENSFYDDKSLKEIINLESEGGEVLLKN